MKACQTTEKFAISIDSIVQSKQIWRLLNTLRLDARAKHLLKPVRIKRVFYSPVPHGLKVRTLPVDRKVRRRKDLCFHPMHCKQVQVPAALKLLYQQVHTMVNVELGDPRLARCSQRRGFVVVRSVCRPAEEIYAVQLVEDVQPRDISVVTQTPVTVEKLNNRLGPWSIVSHQRS